MSQEITINIKGPSELKLSITISLDKSVKELKAAISEKSNVEVERQRLIYSGRVLKDDDPLSTYKIQSNHTIHMVKGVAKTTEPPAAQPLPTMQAGQNPADPLTQLNGAMAHGAMAGFNPFPSMGLNTNDPNMMQGVMDSPEFLQQVSAMMSNPAILEQLLASDPNMRAMGPQLRQLLQSDQFRQMVSNPETLRGMFQLASSVRGTGASPFGSLGAGPATGAPNAFASLFAQAPAPTGSANPAPPVTGGTTASPTSPSVGSLPPNPFGAVDPALMQQILGGLGGGNQFGNPFIPFGGSTASPAATAPVGPPPEERFQVQLQQLSDMGFVNAQQNVRALLATGGNVQHAIEYILGGGGL